MSYLHGCDISFHGKLRSCNCLIDGRFVLKISDFGLTSLSIPVDVIKDTTVRTMGEQRHKDILDNTNSNGPSEGAELEPPVEEEEDVEELTVAEYQQLDRQLDALFTALDDIENKNDNIHAQLQQLLNANREIRTQLNEEPQETKIITRVASRENPPFRPAVSQRDCPEELLDLMERCWNDNPEDRPAFERMEQYANNLEVLVSEKTEELSQEKRRSEELLYQVLPRPVAQQLMLGEMVQPEQFECVTIYFSDIVGFTSLCANSTPMQVVDFLNELYSTFDRIIGFYDVYKVETIGDAYMVVSGLPERNGDSHTREIGLMALAILDAVRSFTIAHQPDRVLQLRIGIHSGPVCAGVVGQKMPHYCLFGDAVNTASRMESTGQLTIADHFNLPAVFFGWRRSEALHATRVIKRHLAYEIYTARKLKWVNITRFVVRFTAIAALKIHVSEAAKQIFDKFGTFNLELRGEVELKGKGFVTTYWLLGCSDSDPRPPTPRVPSTIELDSNNPYPLVFMG
ncbi:hypothetical protein D910_09080 [Dendroctonus ponderosae]|uniref:Guanylate cyclase n=1 Tax=Dendroctonus ponderosae TaxID=77166 RepID=U4UCR8_DENPD|nr:hypothetical protein D910_09080 [Dendroctonus ponderosae]